MLNRMMVVPVVASALLMPEAARSQWSEQHVEAASHFAANESGIKEHRELAGSGKSAAQVAAELQAAQKDPRWAGVLRWGVPIQVPKTAPKTRAEVVAELERAQKSPGWDRASRLGIPLMTVMPPPSASLPRADGSALASADAEP